VVADDVRAPRLQIQTWMQSIGFKSALATDGQEAFRLVVNWKPNLLVTDIDMPQCSGLDLPQKADSERERNHATSER